MDKTSNCVCSQGMKKTSEEGKIGRKLSDHKLNRRSDAEWLHLKPLSEGKEYSVMQSLQRFISLSCHCNISSILQTPTTPPSPATMVTMTRSSQSSRRLTLPPTRRRWRQQTPYKTPCHPPRRTDARPRGTDTHTATATPTVGTATQTRR